MADLTDTQRMRHTPDVYVEPKQYAGSGQDAGRVGDDGDSGSDSPAWVSALRFAKEHPVGTAAVGIGIIALLGPRRVLRLSGKALTLAGTAASVKKTLG